MYPSHKRHSRSVQGSINHQSLIVTARIPFSLSLGLVHGHFQTCRLRVQLVERRIVETSPAIVTDVSGSASLRPVAQYLSNIWPASQLKTALSTISFTISASLTSGPRFRRSFRSRKTLVKATCCLRDTLQTHRPGNAFVKVSTRLWTGAS